jgi:hypothetical protein
MRYRYVSTPRVPARQSRRTSPNGRRLARVQA